MGLEGHSTLPPVTHVFAWDLITTSMHTMAGPPTSCLPHSRSHICHSYILTGTLLTPPRPRSTASGRRLGQATRWTCRARSSARLRPGCSSSSCSRGQEASGAAARERRERREAREAREVAVVVPPGWWRRHGSGACTHACMQLFFSLAPLMLRNQGAAAPEPGISSATRPSSFALAIAFPCPAYSCRPHHPVRGSSALLPLWWRELSVRQHTPPPPFSLWPVLHTLTPS